MDDVIEALFRQKWFLVDNRPGRYYLKREVEGYWFEVTDLSGQKLPKTVDEECLMRMYAFADRSLFNEWKIPSLRWLSEPTERRKL